MIPTGLVDSSEAGRQKIMAVKTEEDAESPVPSRSPSSYSMLPPVSHSVIPPGLEGLSEQEREKIISVMAESEIDSVRIPSRSPSSYSMMPLCPPQFVDPVIPPGLEDLSEEEKRKIMSVMAEAEIDSGKIPSRSSSAHQMIPPGMEDLSEEERSKIMFVMANAEREDSGLSNRITEPPVAPMTPTRGHTGFRPAGIVNEEELFEAERKKREEVERRQTPLESPTRESGYATSTSYERELAMVSVTRYPLTLLAERGKRKNLSVFSRAEFTPMAGLVSLRAPYIFPFRLIE